MNNYHICFIVPNYPCKKDSVYTFVRELVVAISNLGIRCSVIAPQSITNFIYKKKRKRPFHWIDRTEKGYEIDIYQPIHFPFLNIKFGNRNIAADLTTLSFKYAFKKYNIKPDVLYAHFWHSGVSAAEIIEDEDIPLYVASGESKIWVNSLYNNKRVKNTTRKVNGVICVSGKNQKESVQLGLCTMENSIVIPNAINSNVFYKKDKNIVREKLGISRNDFIVAFTGAFTYRKGVLRVVEALKGIPNVKSVFLGSGKQQPTGKNILFKGRVSHTQVADYLNAADVFVLPTLAEGSSNAIIEAMACGLPIVSSDLSFNDEILNEKNSIRIDPINTHEISKAIILLKDNPKERYQMSKNALITADNLDINTRAKKILNYMGII